MKPSAEQTTVLRELRTDGVLERWPGGFWTAAGTPACKPGVPAWFVGIQTVRAMERRGWLERVGLHAQEWRDSRRLTDAGKAAKGAP